MFDAKRLLDALIGAVQPGGNDRNAAAGAALDQARQGVSGFQGAAHQLFGHAISGVREAAGDANRATGIGASIDAALGAHGGPSPADHLVERAKQAASANPGLAQAALLGAAGLLLGSRKGRGLAANAAGLSGLALIGGLAYKAFQARQGEAPNAPPALPASDDRSAGARTSGVPPTTAGAASNTPLFSPLPAPEHPRAIVDASHAADDDALLFVRAMVAAASADGRVTDDERARIFDGLAQAGIDEAATRWLERELADPASIDEIAEPVTDPEKAAQVYAAARLAIDPDTLQEREFLRQLAAALDLEPTVVSEIDDGAGRLVLPSRSA